MKTLGAWHTWHIAVVLALAAASGCGGTATGGAAGAAGLACETDLDCVSHSCVDRRCVSPTDGGVGGGSGGTGGTGGASAGGVAGAAGGAAGTRDGGGSQPWGSPAGGGGTAGSACSGSAYGFPWGGTTSGTGGAPPVPPSPGCTLDSTGTSSATFDDVCALVRCPARSADLVAGLDCTALATDTTGITLITGCGLETVQVAGAGVVYEATFDPAQSGPISVRTEQEYAFSVGACTWSAFRAGKPRPTCDSEIRHRCTRPPEPPGVTADCREPAQDGCAVCCKPWASGGLSGCNVSATSGPGGRYDVSTSAAAPCPCNCRTCADCTTELEHRLRVAPDMPQCHCPPSGSGGSTGAAGATSASGGAQGAFDPCDGYCVNAAALTAACPDVKR